MNELIQFITQGETTFTMPVIIGFFAFMCVLWFISSLVEALINVFN